MVHRNRLLVVLLAVLASLFSGLSGASAGGGGYTGAPQIRELAGAAWADGSDSVTVRGMYRCSGPDDAMHLWVSVKQGGPDPTAEGSSSTVDAWYDTNISMDVDVTCDGRWHNVTVDLGRHPTDFTGRELGYLDNGKAWLQFCLVSMQDQSLLASESRWVQVTHAGH